MRVSFCILLFITAVFVSVTSAQPQEPQPKLISAPEPVYPKEAKDAAIGGRVSVAVVVDESGAIVSIHSPTGPARVCKTGDNDPRVVALRNSVVESMKGAKFEPAMKDGKPVKSVAYVGTTFDPADQGPDPLPPGKKKILKIATITSNAVSMPKPEYPRSAFASRASGAVSVVIMVEENGDVITASPVSGHPLLRNAAAIAACEAKFKPTLVDGTPVRVSGLVSYVFSPR